MTDQEAIERITNSTHCDVCVQAARHLADSVKRLTRERDLLREQFRILYMGRGGSSEMAIVSLEFIAEHAKEK